MTAISPRKTSLPVVGSLPGDGEGSLQVHLDDSQKIGAPAASSTAPR